MGIGKWINITGFIAVIGQLLENPVQTDDISGPIKTRETSIDHAASIPLAMNVGLDSYLDVRLAMHLFRSVYYNEGNSILPRVTNILLSALETNPHVPEAWETDFYASGYDDFAK